MIILILWDDSSGFINLPFILRDFTGVSSMKIECFPLSNFELFFEGRISGRLSHFD
jgi:hypothetical protein